MSGIVIEVADLSRRFGQTVALDAVNLRVEKGCVHGLVGANGAGKTTLIKHLLGLLRAERGSVRVFGLDPVGNPVDVLRHVGYLSEERDLPEWMRVGELMRYTQAYHPSWDTDYASELLRTFGLDPSKRVKELSRGMRAQAGLIAAVAHRPELLLLDEPSTGLDAVVRRDILNEIVRAVADDGRTVVFSSHLLDEVQRMSDDVSMIHKGAVVLQGSVDEITQSHHLLNLRFPTPLSAAPKLDHVLWCEGDRDTWNAVCNGNLPRVREAVHTLGGEIVQVRNPSLQEIFVARVTGDRIAGRED